jgi:hypothetical protein
MTRTHSEYVVLFTNGEFKFFFAEDMNHLKELTDYYHNGKEVKTIFSSIWSNEKSPY